MCLCVPVLCMSAYICYIQPETYCVRRVSLVFDAADLFIHKKKKQKNKKYIKPGHTPAVITAAHLLSCSTTTNQCRAILFGNKLSLFFHLSSSLFPTSHRKLTLKEWLFIVLLAEVVVWLCGRSRLKRVAASVLNRNSDFQLLKSKGWFSEHFFLSALVHLWASCGCRGNKQTQKNQTLVRRSLTEKAFGFGSAGEETQVFLQVPL